MNHVCLRFGCFTKNVNDSHVHELPDHELVKMFFLNFIFLCVLFFSGSNGVGRNFCQPGDTRCWPTNEEINQFRNSLSTADANCLNNFPTFTSKDNEGGLIINTW